MHRAARHNHLDQLTKTYPAAFMRKHRLTRDRKGRTPLHGAASCGQLDRCSERLRPEDLLTPDASGVTPLHWAASGWHLDQVSELCEAVLTAENLAVGDNKGMTPLHYAALAGNLEQACSVCADALTPENLLKPDKAGQTPLHCAVRKGDLRWIPLIDPTALPEDLRSHPILQEMWKERLGRQELGGSPSGGAEVGVELA